MTTVTNGGGRGRNQDMRPVASERSVGSDWDIVEVDMAFDGISAEMVGAVEQADDDGVIDD